MEIKLTAQIREAQEKLTPDFMPAVLYGKGLESRSLKINKINFTKVFEAAGESNLISLEVDGQSVNVLVKDTQRDVLKHTFTHVDFYQVNMKEKVTTEIPLHFLGESKAVKELGGMLMKEIDALEVECLPADLVDHIDVDISILNTFDDIIRVNDIVLPKGLELTHSTNDIVVSVKEPKAEVIEEAPVAEVAPEAKKAEGDKEEEKK
jgi:large subunit ribosomal protein L25